MVGPYAMMLRLPEDNRAEVVSSGEPSIDKHEALVIRLLSSLKLLTPSELARPIPLRLPNTNPGDVRIYQALFCDDDVLPWEG